MRRLLEFQKKNFLSYESLDSNRLMISRPKFEEILIDNYFSAKQHMPTTGRCTTSSGGNGNVCDGDGEMLSRVTSQPSLVNDEVRHAKTVLNSVRREALKQLFEHEYALYEMELREKTKQRFSKDF